MANVFDQFDQGRGNPFDQFDSPAPPQRGASTLAKAAASGANSALPQLAGFPVDFATSLINEAWRTFGPNNKLLHLDEVKNGTYQDKPLLNPDQVGGSESIKRAISSAAGVDPFSNPNPEDPVARMVHTTANIAASGGRRAPSMIPTGILTAIGSELAGAPGAVAGSLLPMLRGQAKINPTGAKAIESGYTLPPAQVSPTIPNKIMEGLAGSAASERAAARSSQANTDRLTRQDLGLPENAPLNRQTLASVRNEAGAAYEAVKKSGVPIRATNAYIDGIASLGEELQSASKEFPALFKNPKLDELKDSLLVSNMSPEAAVELTKKLRNDASANLKSFGDPEKTALGYAQRKAAGLVEDMVRDNLSASGRGDLVNAWNAARTRIAKTHDYEAALDQHGNIDARILGQELDKGAPMSGAQRQIAEFGSAFSKSARTPEALGSEAPQINMRSVGFKYGVPGLAAAAMGGWPAAVATEGVILGAPPIARSVILSRPYQNSLLRPRRRNALAPYIASEQ